ncbi:LysR family transcriptional regulator [Micromonospora sp. NPDC006766]|uniref:LysR family transcriptional regulator n=1 Tax=Micromonospora sp. NPDC006766 TaxID=3154778 RepID=UPI0033E9F422
MDLRSLRQFLVVARHQHLSRAALELRVAQPALSRTIGRLESELGTPLFDRRDRMRLNAAGAVFRDHVQRAFGELDAGVNAVTESLATGVGRVTLASESLFTLMRPLAAFKQAHPLVEVGLLQGSAAVMVQQVRARDADLCLMSQPVTSGDLQAQELIHEQVFLTVPINHPLAGRDSVDVEDLADQSFVTTRPGQWQRQLLDRLFAARGLTPRIVCESDEPGAAAAMISVGVGIGLLPAVARREAWDVPLVWIAVDDPTCIRTLSLAWRRAGISPGAPQMLRDHLLGWDWGGSEPTAFGAGKPAGPGKTARVKDSGD